MQHSSVPTEHNLSARWPAASDGPYSAATTLLAGKVFQKLKVTAYVACWDRCFVNGGAQMGAHPVDAADRAGVNCFLQLVFCVISLLHHRLDLRR
jgi:hypothetical protein